MSLSILSKNLVNQEETFKNVSLAALKAKMSFLITENAMKDDGRIELTIGKDSRTKTISMRSE